MVEFSNKKFKLVEASGITIDLDDLNLDQDLNSNTQTNNTNQSWDQRYANIDKSNPDQVNQFWNDYLSNEKIWGKHAKGNEGFTVDKLGEAIIAECESYGFESNTNPFINFANYFMDSSNENLARFYAIIHNYFANSYDSSLISKLNDGGPIRTFWDVVKGHSNLSQLKSETFRDYLDKNLRLYTSSSIKNFDYQKSVKDIFTNENLLHPDIIRSKFEELTGYSTKEPLSAEAAKTIQLSKDALGYFIWIWYTRAFKNKNEFDKTEEWIEFMKKYQLPSTNLSALEPIKSAADSVANKFDLTKGQGNLNVLKQLISLYLGK